MRLRKVTLCVVFVGAAICASSALALDRAAIDRLVMANDVQSIESQGQGVMPILADIYRATNDKQKRAKVAGVFYQLSWKSEIAKAVMMEDVHTDDRNLRLQVQWALGRVSNDDRIVDALLGTMQEDGNPLFREKAACALASDQIHLSPQQRYELLKGLVHALADPKFDVRSNATLALQIQTGQTKGFNPLASEAERQAKIQEWEKWLREYSSNL